MIWALIFFVVVLGGWCVWLTLDRQAIADQLDEVRDESARAHAAAADAKGDVRRAIEHLTDADPGTGRHHDPTATARPRPYPRPVLSHPLPPARKAAE